MLHVYVESLSVCGGAVEACNNVLCTCSIRTFNLSEDGRARRQNTAPQIVASYIAHCNFDIRSGGPRSKVTRHDNARAAGSDATNVELRSGWLNSRSKIDLLAVLEVCDKALLLFGSDYRAVTDLHWLKDISSPFRKVVLESRSRLRRALPHDGQ